MDSVGAEGSGPDELQVPPAGLVPWQDGPEDGVSAGDHDVEALLRVVVRVLTGAAVVDVELGSHGEVVVDELTELDPEVVQAAAGGRGPVEVDLGADSPVRNMKTNTVKRRVLRL